jgi:hypothetical protein
MTAFLLLVAFASVANTDNDEACAGDPIAVITAFLLLVAFASVARSDGSQAP